jgi:hypothetical protein
MNKQRIDELVSLATKTERHYTGVSGYDVSEFDKEKFAELIMEECKVERLKSEVAAWNERFPQYKYRAQDDCVALR